jgi:ribose 5-phosphate isomerase B
MRIALGSDHAGYPLKSLVAKHLLDAGHDVLDVGTDSEESVDYPGFCATAARAVTSGDADLAIVFGGSGQGEQIAANKVHNDANVLALGGRVLGSDLALSIVDAFLSQSFDGGRHERRIGQITQIEQEECGRE